MTSVRMSGLRERTQPARARKRPTRQSCAAFPHVRLGQILDEFLRNVATDQMLSAPDQRFEHVGCNDLAERLGLLRRTAFEVERWAVGDGFAGPWRVSHKRRRECTRSAQVWAVVFAENLCDLLQLSDMHSGVGQGAGQAGPSAGLAFFTRRRTMERASRPLSRSRAVSGAVPAAGLRRSGKIVKISSRASCGSDFRASGPV